MYHPSPTSSCWMSNGRRCHQGRDSGTQNMDQSRKINNDIWKEGQVEKQINLQAYMWLADRQICFNNDGLLTKYSQSSISSRQRNGDSDYLMNSNEQSFRLLEKGDTLWCRGSMMYDAAPASGQAVKDEDKGSDSGAKGAYGPQHLPARMKRETERKQQDLWDR